MNTELVKLLLGMVFGTALIMAFIALACVATPKIARFIIKRNPKLAENPERVEETKANSEPEVKGPYDAQKEEYDLNYKIYNKDIYGVDFKNGKEK